VVAIPQPRPIWHAHVEGKLGIGTHERRTRTWPLRRAVVLLLALATVAVVHGVGVTERLARVPRSATASHRRRLAGYGHGDGNEASGRHGRSGIGDLWLRRGGHGRVQRTRCQYAALRGNRSRVAPRPNLFAALGSGRRGRAGGCTLVESSQEVARAEPSQEQLPSAKDVKSARGSPRGGAKAIAAAADATLQADGTLRKARIVSPIDGIVLTLSVEPGQTTQVVLAEPADAADIGRDREGMRATVTS